MIFPIYQKYGFEKMHLQNHMCMPCDSADVFFRPRSLSIRKMGFRRIVAHDFAFAMIMILNEHEFQLVNTTFKSPTENAMNMDFKNRVRRNYKCEKILLLMYVFASVIFTRVCFTVCTSKTNIYIYIFI